MSDYIVVPLANHREQIGPLARLLNAEWGHLEPWRDVPALVAGLTERCKPAAAPFALVALDGDSLLGSASVKFRELAQHPDKSWWIGDVIVDRCQRGKGIGGRLVDAAVRHARDIGISELFLYTPDQEDFYRKRDWQSVGRDSANGEDNVIMKLLLRDDNSIVSA